MAKIRLFQSSMDVEEANTGSGWGGIRMGRHQHWRATDTDTDPPDFLRPRIDGWHAGVPAAIKGAPPMTPSLQYGIRAKLRPLLAASWG